MFAEKSVVLYMWWAVSEEQRVEREDTISLHFYEVNDLFCHDAVIMISWDPTLTGIFYVQTNRELSKETQYRYINDLFCYNDPTLTVSFMFRRTES